MHHLIRNASHTVRFLQTENGVKIAQESYGEFFLTSRGTINVDLNKLYEIYGYEEQDN
ncbi:Uncharacterised protein [Citrobacter freundii]|nr:Uncharacterised protein [Citrobacter freundii]